MEKNPSKFAWHYIKKFKWLLIFTFTTITISTLLSRLAMLYTAKLFDIVSSKSSTPEYFHDIVSCIIIITIFSFIKYLSGEIPWYYHGKYQPRVNAIITGDVFEHVNRHSIAFFNEEMSGNVSNKVSQLSSGVSTILDNSFYFSQLIVTFLITIFMMASVSIYLFPIIIIWIGIITWLSVYWADRRRANSKIMSKVQSETNGIIVDSISNYSEIKSFANFRYERRKIGINLRRQRIYEAKDRILFFSFHFCQQTVLLTSMVLFMTLTAWMLYKGQIDTVGFIFSNTMLAALGDSVFGLSFVYNGLARTLGTIQSALSTLAVNPEIQDKPDAKPLNVKKANIVFDNVSFGYKDKKKLFNKLNLEIKQGEKVGLVGHSGAGKSTFIKLIARYFDTQEGSIKINGIDIRDITQDSLHRHIATIPQDVSLFNRTLKENIRYGRISASDAEVIKASQKASAHEFISALPDGYDTKVGERGVVLSGGERQRIAIARAILKNSPILIFDEATSALDSGSEKHIQKSLKTLMQNKTVIAVAHRLSTLREMDRIIVFDKGKVVEEGTHMSLLRKKGVYSKLYKMQADGFLSE